MNKGEYYSGDASAGLPLEPLLYKDRSTGLSIFGALTILLGCLCGLFVPLMIFGQVMSARVTKSPANYLAILPATFVYGILAVALVWLGVGSMMARRWARALLVIFSWSWLGIGIISLAAMAFVVPRALANLPTGGVNGQAGPPPAAMLSIVMVFMFLFVGFILIVLPGIWAFFYSSRHVKATCEERDRETRWTDVCPLPVLGCCLWLWFSSAMMLVMPIAGMGVAPFFGMFVTGIIGSLWYFALAGIWAFAGWLLYHLDSRGWWMILVAMGVFVASAMLTYARHDTMEMYRLMGYPEAQIEQIRRMGLLKGNAMSWVTLGSMVPMIAYLLFIRKYLVRKSQTA